MNPEAGLDAALLDAALLDAHTRGDAIALVGLYEAAAARVGAAAAAFHLTQAYVFALETGDARAERLHARLTAMGREE